MRVAYYSPLPPSRSGIADYSTLLLPALEEHMEIVLAHPGKRAPAADVALYHVGNDPEAHGWIVDALFERPGVVVLHEFVLHHLIAGITIGRGNGRGYLDAMERDLGVAGRLLGLGVLDNLLPLLWETQPERFPLSGVVLDQARGLIVHSRYVAQRAREAGYDGRLWRIPHPVWPTPAPERARDVGGEPLIGCFGFLNMNKRIPQLLEAFASFRRSRPGARLLLVGGAGERFDVGRRLERLGLTEGVERLDYVPEERMWSLMAACDVLVNLRYPTMGETSGSVVRALGLGKPLLVSDVGWFSELPDDAVLKIPVDDFEVPLIEAALGFAVEHGATLGAAARAYVEREHSLVRTAADYALALETAAGADAVDDAVLWRIAEAATEVGIDDPGRLARAAAEAGILG
jgi:glycosyltransferase involved in cell wall biosynthesis